LDAWRQRWRVPNWVSMVELDRRQPVDLSHRLHRFLLRNRLNRSGRLELREASGPEENAWLGRRHEVLIPLFLDQSSAGREPTPVTGPRQVVAGNAGHLPGDSRIVCAQLHGHPGRFDEVLTQRLAKLLVAFGDEDRPSWWFRRHRQMSLPDADQYLVLYLRLPGPSTYSLAAERLSEWANALRAERLLSHFALVTYEPQAGRFGEATALDRAYEVFAADSAAALAQINLAVRAGAHAQAAAAASFVDLVVNFAGSVQIGSEWLIHQLRREHGPLDPALREQTLALADPDGTLTMLRSLPGGDDVVTAWRSRAAALSAYREALAAQRDPLTVLPSLLHLHHNRSVGVDPVIERVTGRLARACALRHNARRAEKQ
jgi:thiopeptide-type bacteriocin biosynthesis protein